MRISHSTMAGLQLSTVGRLSDLIPPRDYSYLNRQDAQLRVWLPDPAKQALEELCEINEMSMTAYLTEYFASYLFGHHEVMRMRACRSGLYEPEPERRYCAIDPDCPEREPELASDLGKNIYALKIWLPTKIKDRLRSEAERSHMTLGELSRTLICSHLFGCEYRTNILNPVIAKSEYKARMWEADSTND